MKNFFFFILMAPIALFPAIVGADAALRFTIQMEGADRIEWSEEGDGVLFSIHSRRGIGRATLAPENGVWPSRAAFRLYLKGLERFRVDNGRYTVTTSVSSLPPHGVICELIRPGEGAVSITEADPLWTPAVLTPENGASIRVPLENGWIEVRPPEALLEGDPDALEIQWVDFYR